MSRVSYCFLIILVSGFFFLLSVPAEAQIDEDKRQSLQGEIERLEREAAELDSSIQKAQAEGRTLQSEVKILSDEIKRRLLEIRRLTLAVQQAESDIEVKVSGIEDLTRRIEKVRSALAKNIKLLYQYDQENLLLAAVKHQTLSDFFVVLDNLETIQSEVEALVRELKNDKAALEREKIELEDFRVELLDLRALQEVERREAERKRLEKDNLLKVTRGREAEFQKLLVQKKLDISALKTQLFYLEKTGITAEEALKYAELAARRTGIRPAFLLALLEVETGRQFEGGVISAGTYLGTGNWRTDMYECYIRLGRRSAAEAQKNAFFAITSRLNFDPDKMPVSRRPSYGCGGAMGPAQFIPTTWLLFEEKTAQLTGHNPPSPWNIEDAFTASAIFLAEAGAKSQARPGELRAARTYISGKPSCPVSGSARYACIAYANRVLALSADIEKVI